MKRIWKPLLVILVLAAAAGGGYWYYQTYVVNAASSAKTTYTQIVSVRQGSLSNTLSVVGELDAVQSADLAFAHMTTDGKLASLMVAAGNTVKQGQVLATIDLAPYQQALDQAKSDLQAAQKTLEDVKTPATALEIATADLAIAKANYDIQSAQSALDDIVHPDMASLQSAVSDAQSALATAQAGLLSKQQDTTYKKTLSDLMVAEATPSAEYNRLAAETYSDESYQDRLRVAYNLMMDAQDPRVTTQVQNQADIASAQTKVRDAQQTLAEAQLALGKAQAGGDKLDLANAQLTLQTAKVALQQAQSDRAALDTGPDAADVAADQAAVDAKQLAVNNATVALLGTKLTAPFDGTVLNTDLNAGDQLTASTVVLTIANLNSLQVVASVDETTIRRIAAGQTAEISFDAFPGQTFQGKVLSVPLQGALQNDVMVYEVPLSLEGTADLPVKVGMTANVVVQVAQADNALLVPTLALQKTGDQYQVMLANSDPKGAPIVTPVQVGLSDGTFTQVTQGLKEGDQIVVTLPSVTNQNNNRFPGGGFGGGFGGGGGFVQPARRPAGR